jgi:hypothetical protein
LLQRQPDFFAARRSAALKDPASGQSWTLL